MKVKIFTAIFFVSLLISVVSAGWFTGNVIKENLIGNGDFEIGAVGQKIIPPKWNKNSENDNGAVYNLESTELGRLISVEINQVKDSWIGIRSNAISLKPNTKYKLSGLLKCIESSGDTLIDCSDNFILTLHVKPKENAKSNFYREVESSEIKERYSKGYDKTEIVFTTNDEEDLFAYVIATFEPKKIGKGYVRNVELKEVGEEEESEEIEKEQVCQSLIDSKGIIKEQWDDYVLIENQSFEEDDFGDLAVVYQATYSNPEGKKFIINTVVFDKNISVKDLYLLKEIKELFWETDFYFGDKYFSSHDLNDVEEYYVLLEEDLKDFFYIWYNQNVLIYFSFREDSSNSLDFIEKLKDNKIEPINLDYNFEKDLLENYFDKCPSKVDEDCSPAWDHQITPLICPPHGYRIETWRDRSGCTKGFVEEKTYCNPGICEGCSIPIWLKGYKSKCVPYGFRFIHSVGYSQRLDEVDHGQIGEEDYNYDLEVLSDHEAVLKLYDYEIQNYTEYNLVLGEEVEIKIPLWEEELSKIILIVDNIYYIENGESYIFFTVKSYVTVEDPLSEENVRELNAYCDIDGVVKEQKEDVGSCQNNYECESNSCAYGQCEESVGRSVGGLKKFMCRVFSVLPGITYEECIAEE